MGAQKNRSNWLPYYIAAGKKTYCSKARCGLKKAWEDHPGPFATKAAAEAHAKACEGESSKLLTAEAEWHLNNPDPDQDDLSPAQAARLTLQQTWDRYKRLVRIELRSLENTATQMDKRILPKFGAKRPDDISWQAIDNWITSLVRDPVITDGMINATLKGFAAVMTYAIKHKIRLDPVNPCADHDGLVAPVRAKKDNEFNLPNECWALLDNAWPTEGLQLWAYTLNQTGARVSEVAALRVESHEFGGSNNVHLERRLTWPKANEEQGHAGGPVQYRNTKNKKVRTFSVEANYIKAVEAWVTKHNLQPGDLLYPAALVLPKRPQNAPRVDIAQELTPEFIATLGFTEPAPNGKRYAHGTRDGKRVAKCDCGWCALGSSRYDVERRAKKGAARKAKRPTPVATVGREDFVSYDSYHWAWTKAVKKSGIGRLLTWHPTPHCLRHTYATALASAGVPVTEIQRRLGHQGIATTLGYIHAAPEADALAGKALGDRFKLSQCWAA